MRAYMTLASHLVPCMVMQLPSMLAVANMSL